MLVDQGLGPGSYIYINTTHAMTTKHRRSSVKETVRIRNTFINWAPQKDTNSIKRSYSWPLLAENQDQDSLSGLKGGVNDTIEEDLRSRAPSFRDLSCKKDEMHDVKTTELRDVDAMRTWRPRLPARPPHLGLRDVPNFRQIENPPSVNILVDSCRHSRCADCDLDSELSLRTRLRVPSTEAARSAQQSARSMLVTDVSHGVGFSDGATETDSNDTPTTKNSDGKASLSSVTTVATIASILYVTGSSTPFLDARATTAVIRNLNRHLTLSDFIATLDDSGFMGTYDFVNLPFRPRKKHNIGIAFINFLTPFQAQLFSDHGRYMGAVYGRKSRRISITLSDVQGTELNIKRIEDSLKDKIGNEPLPPTVAFLQGEIVTFPLCYIPEH